MGSNFVKGVNIMLSKNGTLDYCFDHDIAYLNSIDAYDVYEINELFDLGFYIEEDCFIAFS